MRWGSSEEAPNNFFSGALPRPIFFVMPASGYRQRRFSQRFRTAWTPHPPPIQLVEGLQDWRVSAAAPRLGWRTILPVGTNALWSARSRPCRELYTDVLC